MSGAQRLPAPWGAWISREREIAFRFEGRDYLGHPGDTIASALAAHGRWVLSRSFKYHRPRALRSLAGLEADTLVQVGGEPNVPADLCPIEPGLEVRGQNYTGSLDADRAARIGRLARFLPVGFYYKAFYRPRGAWERFWEPIMRRRGGLGRLALDAPARYCDKSHLFCDIAVVGAGPAGLSAALAGAAAGAEVLLIEMAPRLGGATCYARFDAAGERAERVRRELVDAVLAEPGIEVLSEATCNGLFADNLLEVIRGDRLYKVRAREVVLATGVMEQPAVFRNNDLPGVMLGSAAQRLLRLYAVRPGRRAVVLTANPHGHAVALDLDDAGVEVAAVIDLRPGGDGPLERAVRERGLPVLAGHTVHAAQARGDGLHLAAVELARVTGRGACEPVETSLGCDLLCVSTGYMPAYQLALHRGARLDYDDRQALFSIVELPAGVRLAGSVNGAHALQAALAEGRHAGWAAARALGLEAGAEPDLPGERGARGSSHPWPIFPHPRGKEFVDLDEDLQIADIYHACADGYDEIELVKRYSTVGMGPSQGRHSALATARLVADATGRSVAEVGVTTARPPLHGERLGVLAGRPFEPERFTPIHDRHLEAGAQLMTAGLWWRPAYYGPPAERDQRIRAEVEAIRTRVGLIDVSTLGGLEVCGPDAAEFLNRMYTFGYAKQPLGRARYVLMTNQAGTIVDDGVACRLAPEHFYVTASTGGVEAVYRNMLWWLAQWRLDVVVVNATAAYAAVNIAGPLSRRVLARVCDDVDLSGQGFPYMGVREGTVAGIPARLIRVGFVGELGYEIHVPSGYGEALWDALVEAGREERIQPVGVEAQRVLRLEKGHIIIGQDSDAMTTPEEAQMSWAVSRRKPFFIGARALDIRSRHPSRRKLVGFVIEHVRGTMPQESDLVLDGEAIAGFVTSVALSPTLGQVIGLAYAPRSLRPGATIRIKLGDASVTRARVVDPPFYDRDNARQEI